MPTFQYTAKDQNARTITGKIVATDETQVLDELRKRRLVILDIKEQRSKMMVSSAEGAKAIKIEEVILFTRQMATMIDAGLAIVQSLQALADQTTNKVMRDVIRDVCARVESGDSFSEALQKHPKAFSRLYVCMVGAG